MFGIDGTNNLSRTFATSSYFKFLVISEDGAKIKSNKNYLIPKTSLGSNVTAIENGFLILSHNLGNVISLEDNDFGKKSTVYSQEAGKYIVVTEGIRFSNNTTYEKGIKIYKFNNSAELVKELIVDNPSDKNIKKPELKHFRASENYMCIHYWSYEQDVVNVFQDAFKLFDFDLNLKSTYVEKNRGDVWFLVMAKDDVFYSNSEFEYDSEYRVIIPFKYH